MTASLTMATKILLLALSLLHACIAVDVPSVPLVNGAKPGTKMPAVGIGTGGYVHEPRTEPGEIWTDDVAEKAVTEWLKLGGRRIDASLNYQNQPGVARAIKASKIPREELFIVSKVGSGGGILSGGALGYNDTLKQIPVILDTLQVDYLDLLLIHWPGPPGNSSDPECQGNPDTWRACRQSTWKALIEVFNQGKARAIGVSNFEKEHLEDIILMSCSSNQVLPAVNQVEFHPYWHEDELLSYCKDFNIVFNGYSPLSCPDWAPTKHHWNHTVLQEPVVVSIAQAHNHTAAQVILRWEWQQGVISQPRTVDPDHMKENLSIYDFKLTEDDMKQISGINPPADPKVCPDPHKFK